MIADDYLGKPLCASDMAPKLHWLLPEGQWLLTDLLLVCVMGVIYPMNVDLLWPNEHFFGEARDSFVMLIGHFICFHAVLHLMSLIALFLEGLGFLFLQP